MAWERKASCIKRWEPVFRGERRKLILDRAKQFFDFVLNQKRGKLNEKREKTFKDGSALNVNSTRRGHFTTAQV